MKRPPQSLSAPLLLVPALFFSGTRAEHPAYGPKEGATLVKKFQTESDISLEEMTFEIDGQDVSSMAGDMDMSLKTARVLTVTDHYQALGQGRPGRLKRTYDEISSKTHVLASNPVSGDQDLDIPGSSELEGTSVQFAWNADSAEYDVTFAEGSDGDQALLENLAENLDLRGFLPDQEVSEGDTWKVPADAVKAALAPGGALKLKPDSNDERFAGMGGFDQFDINDLVGSLEGDFVAEYAGTRTEGGAEVAVIKLKLAAKCAQDLSGKAEEMKQNLPEGLEMDIESFDGEFSYDAEGELLWSLETGLPHSLELAGDVTLITDVSMTIQMGEKSQKMSQSMTFGGNQTISLSTGE